jgi:hypothetical protein
MRDYVTLIQDCLHILEDTTMYVPAAVAKAAYAPGDMLRRKVRHFAGFAQFVRRLLMHLIVWYAVQGTRQGSPGRSKN